MRSPLEGPRPAWALAVLLALGALAAAAQEPPPAPAAQFEVPAQQAQAPKEKKPSLFKDAADGAFDCSDYLLNHRGFLPVPFLITEPAVGYGAGLGLVWFRQSLAQMEAQARATGGRMVPPDIAVLAAFKTDNGTAGWGGGYLGNLKGDRFRYQVIGGEADLKLDFYGPLQIPRRFDIRAPLLKADGLFRLGRSDWFLGLRYVYFGASCRFEGTRPSFITERELEESVGQAFFVAQYDSRDNTLTPSRGAFAEIQAGFARAAFGSSSSFESQSAKAYTYLPFGASFVLALRGQGQWTGGRVPFYAKPYLSLRGIPAMRYQGENTLLGEAELRWNLTRRWALLGFGGLGKAYGGRTDFADAETAGGGGVGFRYLIARKLGLYTGVDVARGTGTGDTAVYFQVGSAWR